jgi:hypothetical protein
MKVFEKCKAIKIIFNFIHKNFIFTLLPNSVNGRLGWWWWWLSGENKEIFIFLFYDYNGCSSNNKASDYDGYMGNKVYYYNGRVKEMH